MYLDGSQDRTRARTRSVAANSATTCRDDSAFGYPSEPLQNHKNGSYEEYHPYGTTAWIAPELVTVSTKRYRFTGMERDEETGLQCHGVRYYAMWLGRWTSADPIGLGDGVNRFAYCHGGPVGRHDPRGMDDSAGIPETVTIGGSTFNVLPDDVQAALAPNEKRWSEAKQLLKTQAAKDAYDREMSSLSGDPMAVAPACGPEIRAADSAASACEIGTARSAAAWRQLGALAHGESGGIATTALAIATGGDPLAGAPYFELAQAVDAATVAVEVARPPSRTPVTASGPRPRGWADVLTGSGSTKPGNMAKPHAHHIVMQGDFSKWTAENRAFVEDSRRILGENGIDWMRDPANLTWAENRGHSVEYAKKVWTDLKGAETTAKELGLTLDESTTLLRVELRDMGRRIRDGTY